MLVKWLKKSSIGGNLTIFSLGTQTIQVHMEAGRHEVAAQICSLGEPDLVVKGRVLGDGLKWPYQNSLKDGRKNFFVFEIQNFENGQKQSKNGQKWPKMKIFDQNFWKKNFFSESIQNVSKRILNRKSWFRKKKFPLKIFL